MSLYGRVEDALTAAGVVILDPAVRDPVAGTFAAVRDGRGASRASGIPMDTVDVYLYVGTETEGGVQRRLADERQRIIGILRVVERAWVRSWTEGRYDRVAADNATNRYAHSIIRVEGT